MKISQPTYVQDPKSGERVRVEAGKVPAEFEDLITNPYIIVGAEQPEPDEGDRKFDPALGEPEAVEYLQPEDAPEWGDAQPVHSDAVDRVDIPGFDESDAGTFQASAHDAILGDETTETLNAMSKAEMKDFAELNNLSLEGTSKLNADDLRAHIKAEAAKSLGS